MNKPVVVKVSKTSQPAKVAGAIAGMTRQGDRVDVRAVGPYAINQAVNAIALATQFLYDDGIALKLEIMNVVINKPFVSEDRGSGRALAGISFLTEYDVISQIGAESPEDAMEHAEMVDSLENKVD